MKGFRFCTAQCNSVAPTSLSLIWMCFTAVAMLLAWPSECKTQQGEIPTIRAHNAEWDFSGLLDFFPDSAERFIGGGADLAIRFSTIRGASAGVLGFQQVSRIGWSGGLAGHVGSMRTVAGKQNDFGTTLLDPSNDGIGARSFVEANTDNLPLLQCRLGGMARATWSTFAWKAQVGSTNVEQNTGVVHLEYGARLWFPSYAIAGTSLDFGFQIGRTMRELAEDGAQPKYDALRLAAIGTTATWFATLMYGVVLQSGSKRMTLHITKFDTGNSIDGFSGLHYVLTFEILEPFVNL